MQSTILVRFGLHSAHSDGAHRSKISGQWYSFSAVCPLQSGWVKLQGLAYREAKLDIEISGRGHRVAEFRVNGVVQPEPFLPSSARGDYRIQIEITNT